MATRNWAFWLQDGRHTIELDHERWSEKVIIRLDGRVIEEGTKFADMGSEYPIIINGHSAIIQIRNNGFTYAYDLIVDGNPIPEKHRLNSPTAPSKLSAAPAQGQRHAKAGEASDKSGRSVNEEAQALARYEQERTQLANQVRSGANWFYWIVGLSVVNTLMILNGGGIFFPLGLGATQLVDGFAIALSDPSWMGDTATYLGLALDFCLLGLFVLFGWLSRKGNTGAFIVGITLYTLDGLVLALFQDWLSVGFHAFALFFLITGVRANIRLQNLIPPEPPEPPEPSISYSLRRVPIK
jgi:hypothetical protein